MNTLTENYLKCRKVILSCQTVAQLTAAVRYVKLFEKKYSNVLPHEARASLKQHISQRSRRIVKLRLYGIKTRQAQKTKNTPS